VYTYKIPFFQNYIPPIPIEVVIIDKKEFKPLSAMPKESDKDVATTVANDTNQNSLNPSPDVDKLDKDVQPAGDTKPLILPDFDIPKSAIDSKNDVALPDIEDIPIEDNPTTFQGPNIDTELKNQDLARRTAPRNDKDSQDGNPTTSGNNIGRDFFDFDEMPTSSRVVLFAPPEPSFELLTDTNIKIKFNIDKIGNTTNIQFITRSGANVEEMARDYISRVKFNSVVYDELDTAVINLKFKVVK